MSIKNNIKLRPALLQAAFGDCLNPFQVLQRKFAAYGQQFLHKRGNILDNKLV
jgi:hypothetical protein